MEELTKSQILQSLTSNIPSKEEIENEITAELCELFSEYLEVYFENSFSMANAQFYIPNTNIEHLKEIFNEKKLNIGKLNRLSYKAEYEYVILYEIFIGDYSSMHKYKYLSLDFILNNFNAQWIWNKVYTHENLSLEDALKIKEKEVETTINMVMTRFKGLSNPSLNEEERTVLKQKYLKSPYVQKKLERKYRYSSIIDRDDITEEIMLSDPYLVAVLQSRIRYLLDPQSKNYFANHENAKFLNINKYSVKFIKVITGMNYETLKREQIRFMLLANISQFTEEDIDLSMTYIINNIEKWYDEDIIDYISQYSIYVDDMESAKKYCTLTVNKTFPAKHIRYMYKKYGEYVNWFSLTKNMPFKFIAENPDLPWYFHCIFENRSLTEVDVLNLIFSDLAHKLFDLTKENWDLEWENIYDLHKDKVSFNEINKIILLKNFVFFSFSYNNDKHYTNYNISLKFVFKMINVLEEEIIALFTKINVENSDELIKKHIGNFNNYRKLLFKGYFNNCKRFEEHFSDLVKKRYLRYFMIQCCYNPASKFRRNKLEQMYDELYS